MTPKCIRENGGVGCYFCQNVCNCEDCEDGHKWNIEKFGTVLNVPKVKKKTKT